MTSPPRRLNASLLGRRNVVRGSVLSLSASEVEKMAAKNAESSIFGNTVSSASAGG